MSSQGHYSGYFKYNNDDVRENFSFILKKAKYSRKTYEMRCYGENDIGPFTMEGQVHLLPLDKLKVKE